MALIIGPLTDPDLTPEHAVVQAFLTIQQTQTPKQEHVLVSPADLPPDLDRPVWRWTLSDDAPPVLDPELTTFTGTVERGRWSPTTPAAPAEIRGGLVVATALGMVVVGLYRDEDDDLAELAEQAMAHVATLFEGD